MSGFSDAMTALHESEDPGVVQALKHIQEALVLEVTSMDTLLHEADCEWGECFQEYRLYAESIMDVLKRRDTIQLNSQVCVCVVGL